MSIGITVNSIQTSDKASANTRANNEIIESIMPWIGIVIAVPHTGNHHNSMAHMELGRGTNYHRLFLFGSSWHLGGFLLFTHKSSDPFNYAATLLLSE